MRNFQPYMVVKDAFKSYAYQSPKDEARYEEYVTLLAKISEYAPTSGGSVKKLSKRLVSKNEDIVETIWDGVGKIRDRVGENSFFIVVWYKFEAECCKCKKGLFRSTYKFVKVETDWKVYPEKKRKSIITTNKFSRENVLMHYVEIMNEYKKNICK